MEGLKKPWESKQCFPLVVISSGIKPFLAPRLYSVFFHSSAKRSIILNMVLDGALMLLYLKVEFVEVKQGDPVPSLQIWWLKLEAGSEIVVFKEGEGCG